MVVSPILVFVIYMSVRVQSENTTQEELILAIGTDTIKGVEMADTVNMQVATSKGPYTHVNAEVI